MRQENAKYISSRISKFPQLSVLTPPSEYEHIYQMFTIRLLNKKIRDDLQNYLTNKRIFSKVYFAPIHLTEFYKKSFGIQKLPLTEAISDQVLTLPLYPNMTFEEKQYLVDAISEFFES